MKKLAMGLTPSGVMVVVGLVILMVEAAIILLISFLQPLFPGREMVFWGVLDPLLLAAFIFPVFYVLIYKPLRDQQAELERQVEVLRHNEQLTALIDAIPDAVFLKDGAGRWRVINEQAKQMFQVHNLPWQGKTEMELAELQPAYRAAHEGCLASDERAWQAGRLVVGEETVIGADGRCAIVEARKMPIFDENGRRKELAIIGRDITERKALEARNERLTKLYTAISEINQAIVRMNDESTLFPLVCRMAVDFGGLKLAWVGQQTGNGLIEPTASYGAVDCLNGLAISSKEDGPEGRGPTGVVWRENHHVIVNDFSASGMTKPWHERALRYGFGSSGVFPIPRAGKPFAVLCVDHAHPHAFDEEMIALLDEMSRDIAFAVDNFDHESERRQSEQALRIAATAFETQEGILIADRDSRIVRVNRAFTRLTGYSAAEVIGRTPAILKSGRQDAAFYRSMWATLARDKYWQGELWSRRKNGETCLEWLTITAVLDEHGQVTHHVGTFSDITLRKEADEEIYRLAFHDPLTNLPNRRLLWDRLQQAMASSARSQRYGALLFLDLDNFKTLNDTRGHDIGDLLLVEVAKRLQGCVRDSDTVARLGGDEFVVMLDDLSEEGSQAAAAAQDVGEKILASLSRPFDLGGIDYHSSGSIGISLFSDDHTSMHDLLKRADVAMYEAKSAGHNTLRFFDPATQA